MKIIKRSRFFKKTIALFAMLLCVWECQAQKFSSVNYKESSEDFPNPERGFYYPTNTRASNYKVLTLDELRKIREPYEPNRAKYKAVSTLVFRYIIMDSFTNRPLSDALLNNIKIDFQVARVSGVKIILRFSYTNSSKKGSCPEKDICPPYGDAPRDIVMGHIKQLTPLLQENADVIACLQMGFIGIWGENYYTDYFGDASPNANQGKLLDSNWNDRIELLKALLQALPATRMIQVRYPQIKQRYVYGINAELSSRPLDGNEAFSLSDKARIGFHNDCFLASVTDFGTYEDYGNSSRPRKEAIDTLRDYYSMDSKYVVVGGETCSNGYSPQNDCEPSGIAQQEFAKMHYSFINSGYNVQVDNDWVTGGCMESIKKKLGYRLVIRHGQYPKSLHAGDSLNVSLAIDNVGYASPFNSRKAYLILRRASTNELYRFEFNTTVQKWLTGSIQLNGRFNLPANLIPDEYELLLDLPDPYPSLAGRAEYSIRLANENTWEATTGYNKLNHKIIIR